MKKVILLLAAGFIGLSAMAQTKTAAKTTTFGIRAGVNLSTFGGDDADDVKSKIGLNAGVYANILISNGFSIQPELAYSQLGCKFEDGGDIRYALDYITLPVLAKYDFSNSGFSLYAGPQIGFLATAKIKDDNDSEDVKDSFKSTDFAGILGAQYLIPSTKFGLTLRYQFGLSNIVDEDNVDLKNNAATLGVFYNF